MYLAMQNPNMTAEQLTEYIERVIRPRMSTVEGVAEVQIFGAANYSMRVWIDPIRLAARGMTAAEVLTAINDFELPVGARQDQERIRRLFDHRAVDAADAGGFRAHCRCTPRTARSCGCATWPGSNLRRKTPTPAVKFNGKPGTFLGIFPTPAANPLTRRRRSRSWFRRSRTALPDRHDDRGRLRFRPSRSAPRSRRCSRRSAKRSPSWSSSSCSSSARSVRC